MSVQIIIESSGQAHVRLDDAASALLSVGADERTVLTVYASTPSGADEESSELAWSSSDESDEEELDGSPRPGLLEPDEGPDNDEQDEQEERDEQEEPEEGDEPEEGPDEPEEGLDEEPDEDGPDRTDIPTATAWQSVPGIPAPAADALLRLALAKSLKGFTSNQARQYLRDLGVHRSSSSMGNHLRALTSAGLLSCDMGPGGQGSPYIYTITEYHAE